MNNSQARWRYIIELDGIRGAAVSAVMLLHARAPYSQGGFIGVDIFFVMSGFLITTLLLREYQDNGAINLKHFYFRRSLRLVPALLLFLGVIILFSFIFLDQEKAEQDLKSAFISLIYISNWVRAFLLHPMDYLGHTWSLSIEEQFYLLWPLMLSMMLRLTGSLRAVALITLSIASVSWMLRAYMMWHGGTIARLYYGFDTRADGLLIGCVLGMWLFRSTFSIEPSQRHQRIWGAISILAAGGLLLFFVRANAYEPYMYTWGFVVVEILAAALICGVLVTKSSLLNLLLKVKPLVWLGSISYGVYLWHYPIFVTLRNNDYSRFEVLMIGVPITVAISALSYYLVERPFLKLKHRYGSTTSHKRAEQPAMMPNTIVQLEN